MSPQRFSKQSPQRFSKQSPQRFSKQSPQRFSKQSAARLTTAIGLFAVLAACGGDGGETAGGRTVAASPPMQATQAAGERLVAEVEAIAAEVLGGAAFTRDEGVVEQACPEVDPAARALGYGVEAEVDAATASAALERAEAALAALGLEVSHRRSNVVQVIGTAGEGAGATRRVVTVTRDSLVEVYGQEPCASADGSVAATAVPTAVAALDFLLATAATAAPNQPRTEDLPATGPLAAAVTIEVDDAAHAEQVHAAVRAHWASIGEVVEDAGTEAPLWRLELDGTTYTAALFADRGEVALGALAPDSGS